MPTNFWCYIENQIGWEYRVTAHHVLYIGQLKMASRLQALQVLPVLTLLQVSQAHLHFRIFCKCFLCLALLPPLKRHWASSLFWPQLYWNVYPTILCLCHPENKTPGEKTYVSCTANPRSLTHADGRLSKLLNIRVTDSGLPDGLFKSRRPLPGPP